MSRKDSLKVSAEGEESADGSVKSHLSQDDNSNLNELPLVGFSEDVSIDVVFEKTGELSYSSFKESQNGDNYPLFNTNTRPCDCS